MALCHVAAIKSIYCAIFHSHLSYVCTAWGQNLNSQHCISFLQKRTMWIINFASFDAHKLPILVKLNIIKFPDLISFCNCCLFINIFWVSPQFFQICLFWHLILMNRILGQHHMVFWQNHLAVLQNMAQMLLLLQL